MSDLTGAVRAVIDGLDAPNGDVKVAIGKARTKSALFKSYVKALAIQLDHATRTQRLVEGSSILPDMDLGAITVGDVEVDMEPEAPAGRPRAVREAR